MHRYDPIQVFEYTQRPIPIRVKSTPCVGVPATCIIRQDRSLRERSLYAMGGTCRPLATHKLARSVSFTTGQFVETLV